MIAARIVHQVAFLTSGAVRPKAGVSSTFSAFCITRGKAAPDLLRADTVETNQAAGMKYVQNPKRRCSHCYVVIENERKFVFCDKYPRHKSGQKLIRQQTKASRIMTHATQGGKGMMCMWTQQGMREDY